MIMGLARNAMLSVEKPMNQQHRTMHHKAAEWILKWCKILSWRWCFPAVFYPDYTSPPPHSLSAFPSSPLPSWLLPLRLTSGADVLPKGWCPKLEAIFLGWSVQHNTGRNDNSSELSHCCPGFYLLILKLHHALAAGSACDPLCPVFILFFAYTAAQHVILCLFPWFFLLKCRTGCLPVEFWWSDFCPARWISVPACQGSPNLDTPSNGAVPLPLIPPLCPLQFNNPSSTSVISTEWPRDGM